MQLSQVYKIKLTLELVFSHIYIVHRIIKNLVNHWLDCMSSRDLTCRSGRATDYVASVFSSAKFVWLRGGRDREVQITNTAVLLCTLLCAYVLEYARSATKLRAARQRKKSTRPLGRRVVCQVGLWRDIRILNRR